MCVFSGCIFDYRKFKKSLIGEIDSFLQAPDTKVWVYFQPVGYTTKPTLHNQFKQQILDVLWYTNESIVHQGIM